MICDISQDKLTWFLREAKEAHAAFEKIHGADPHWEPFYAAFIRARMFCNTVPQAYDMAVVEVLGSSGL